MEPTLDIPHSLVVFIESTLVLDRANSMPLRLFYRNSKEVIINLIGNPINQFIYCQLVQRDHF